MEEGKEPALLVASTKRKEDITWIRSIITRYRDIWIVLDNATASILARENILGNVEPSRIIVFKGRRGEELSLKIYKVVKPEIVYICDKHGNLSILTNLLRHAPVEIKEC